jgi:hypothetical protein
VHISCRFFRNVAVLLLSGSLLLSPAGFVHARGNSDDQDITIPAPPGFPTIARLPVPGLPHGVPVPVPGPVPGVPFFVEKHREWQRPPEVREQGPNRYDNREYSRNRPNQRDDYDSGRHSRPHGRMYRNLPFEAFALSVAGAAFFFHMGNYYQHTDEGYVVVQAPLGARIRTLPERCSPLSIDGRRYYGCDDVYYEMDGDEYIVVEKPSPREYRNEPAGGDFRVGVGDEVGIKVESLNVRSGPGTRFKVIGQLYRGEVVEVSGMEGEWYSFRLPNGSYGWILQEHAISTEADMR